MSDLQKQIEKQAGSRKRAIPGSSYTNDPKNPAPFEQAPKFVDVHEASEFVWVKLIQPKAYVAMMQTIDQGVPIMSITQALLTDGFQQGMWNPDLMLMLIEPTAYMLIALAERADIEMVVYQGQLDDADETEEILGVSFEEEKIRNMMQSSKSGSVPTNIVTPTMLEELEGLPDTESILAAPVTEAAPAPEAEPAPEAAPAPEQESLMAPPQA